MTHVPETTGRRAPKARPASARRSLSDSAMYTPHSYCSYFELETTSPGGCHPRPWREPRPGATAEDDRIALTPDGAEYLLEQAEAARMTPSPDRRTATVISSWTHSECRLGRCFGAGLLYGTSRGIWLRNRPNRPTSRRSVEAAPVTGPMGQPVGPSLRLSQSALEGAFSGPPVGPGLHTRR
jgi:hypothetical protein